MQYYVYRIIRDYMEGLWWTEYRLSDKDICPDYNDAIQVYEKLEYMEEYCSENNLKFVLIDHDPE